jgi:tetratricopeptide (TPR) repeat protein
MKLLIFSIILFFSVFLFFLNLFPLTTEDFLNMEIIKKRNTHEGNLELLNIISNYMMNDSNNYDLYWESSALWYTEGEFYVSDNESKKECFRIAKDFALNAVRLNPEGPDGHYWLGASYGLWAEANGIFSSLFYAGYIIDEMTAVINLKPDYFRGSAWAIRAEVYDLAPGWPISIGDKQKAEDDIKMALKYGGDFRFVLMIYVEMLLNDGRFSEAKEVAEKALALTYDERVPLEEEDRIEKLKGYLDRTDSVLKRISSSAHPGER